MYHHQPIQDWTDVDEGWFFGEWESGPWHGYRTKEKAFGAYGWVSLILCYLNFNGWVSEITLTLESII